MLKFKLTRETKEELVGLNSKLEKIRKRINSIEQFQFDACKMINKIENFQRETCELIIKKDEDLKKCLINEIAKNKIDYDTMLKGHKPKSDFAKMLDTFPYNHCLNDFEVAMVEKALNIQLYPWQKEFLKGSNCVDLTKGSGKTFIFTLAYTLRLITLPMFTDYDNDVHRCFLSPLYSNTETYVGEMFLDFWEKLSVYPFELNIKLELSKDWWALKWDK